MKGFVSYSHEDKKVCDELRKPLKALARIFDIEEFWTDDSTATGRCFRAGYEEAIEASSIHVLLVSRNSIWSDEIMDNEIPRINEKHLRNGDLILPVVLDNCLWDSVLGTLLASPRDKALKLKPLLYWHPIREGIDCVGRQFSKAISDHFGIKPKQLFRWKPR